MIDTVRGVLRVRKWPRKRGTPKSASQRWWNDWFRQANLLAKYADGMSQARAIHLTKGTGLYPRDIMLRAMRGRLYWWIDDDGNRWYPMSGIQDISDTLDVLAQAVGSVLVRAVDRWRVPGPASPTIGHALTYQGSAAPPIWASSGAGVSQQTLPGTPLVPDGTVNSYDFDVSSYASVDMVLDNIGFAAADYPHLRLSTDGGVTFHAGASDYHDTYSQGGTQVVRNISKTNISAANVATGTFVDAFLNNLRAGRATCRATVGNYTNIVRHISDHANFDGPITDIRIYTNAGNTFNSGVIRLVGLLAA